MSARHCRTWQPPSTRVSQRASTRYSRTQYSGELYTEYGYFNEIDANNGDKVVLEAYDTSLYDKTQPSPNGVYPPPPISYNVIDPRTYVVFHS